MPVTEAPQFTASHDIGVEPRLLQAALVIVLKMLRTFKLDFYLSNIKVPTP